jgi:hypothetical protein
LWKERRKWSYVSDVELSVTFPQIVSRREDVNEIKDLDMTINKTNFIYLDKFRISPIIGTGADENYITKTLVN